jgi:hypothetical protein
MGTGHAIGGAIIPAVFALFLSGCGAAAGERPIELGPVDASAGTLSSARKFLEGRWQLESFEIYPPGKPALVLKGSGTLVYDSMSNLRMEVRADEASADMLRAAGIDIRDGIISTDGRTAIDLQNKTLTYVLEGQAPLVQRGPLAVERPRHWVVDANTLTLTTRDDAGRPLSIARWTRTP